MNVVLLIGRLTSDPKVRYTRDQTAVASFSVAIDRGKDKEADFPRVTTFGKSAENVARYCYKGMRVGIEGRLQTGSYTNQDGNTVYTTDVIANRIEYLEWADDDRADTRKQIEQKVEEHDTMDDFEALEEDVPF